MTAEQVAYLQQQVQALHAENQQLRAEMEQLRQRAQLISDAKRQALVGGGRLLVPLLDRQKVVRSFSSLAQTMSAFAGPMEQWPNRDQVLGDARTFMESCVRFVVRRRMLILFFSLLASAIPAIQIWLVVQQNQIIENQNEFFEIQVYDIVSRSMTEGDRNAKLMTGALLSKADLGFLQGVIEEAFNPELAGTYREEGVHVATRRLEDAAFRGYLVRAVVRGVEHRAATDDADELYDKAQPMLHQILADAEGRVPAVMRLGETHDDIDGKLAEQVDNYLVQIGEALRVYGRLARSTDEHDAFRHDVGLVLRRMSDLTIEGNPFEQAYRAALENFLFEVATQATLTDPDWQSSELSPEQARKQGLDKLEEALGGDAADWGALAKQVGGS